MPHKRCGQVTPANIKEGHNQAIDRTLLRLSAALLVSGQVLFIFVSQFHAHREAANDHFAVFAEYADDIVWTGVHLGQYVGMALMLAGLLTLSTALDFQKGVSRCIVRFGAASTVAAFALYGVLQAVDGIALKQAAHAWATASSSEKLERFANVEAIRWLEWGVRSYQDYALGIALLLCAVALAQSKLVARSQISVMGSSGMSFLMQGWVVGTEGFTEKHTILIVLSLALNLVWMVWLFFSVWRTEQRGRLRFG
ncbi:hypothetical protein JJB09_15765 [Rhizobium sp. KVB221]|uniref:DUF4386 family protein n=1 Tax=Rhizobium setariae TaxID=2801340 RepID=A0A936YPV8_9HYPH|nr:hypothetical protein [Rhizobium setariae]MBL0373488.1 hypothetical protein [Rhizobium setariae]